MAHGEALVVTNGEPRPIGELVGDLCAAAGAPRPHRHVPVPLALAVGAAVQSVWGLADRVRPGRISGDPPMTRFVVEQMSTAHWFDQRRTRQLLRWTPAISLDEGLERLRRWYAAGGPTLSRAGGRLRSTGCFLASPKPAEKVRTSAGLRRSHRLTKSPTATTGPHLFHFARGTRHPAGQAVLSASRRRSRRCRDPGRARRSSAWSRRRCGRTSRC